MSSSSGSYSQRRGSFSSNNSGQINWRGRSRDSSPPLNQEKIDYDEDPIVPYEQEFQEMEQQDKQFELAKQKGLEDQLQINLLTLYNPIEIGTQKLPLLLQIDVLKQLDKTRRAPLDLICIVDVSGSMGGMKLKQVQDSLRYITKILNDEDRIAIVSFQNYSRIELPLTRNTEQRKQIIKDRIKGMRAGGGTCISSGFEQGIKLIKNRKKKNPATCIFLLSDGQDHRAASDIKKIMAYYELETENFAMHTFGYGEDHDPKIMDQIAELKQGSFSYISNIEKAPDHFILAMSGLLSIYAQNAIIKISPDQPFKIDKIYGDQIWQNNETQMNYLIVGNDKQIILELIIPDEKQNAIETIQALTVSITCEHILTKQQIRKEKQLKLQIAKQSGDFNENVYINLLRAKGGETISLAKDLVMNRNNEQAKQLLQNMLNEILESPFKEVDELKFLIKDLNTSIQACNSQMNDQQAIQLLINKKRHHFRRQRSVSNSNSWNSVESCNMRQFQNGNLALSDSEDEEMPQKQKKSRQASYKNIIQKISRSGSSRASISPKIKMDSNSSVGSIPSPQMQKKNANLSPYNRRKSISSGSSRSKESVGSGKMRNVEYKGSKNRRRSRS